MCGTKSEERNWRNKEDSTTDGDSGDSVDFLASSGGKAEYPPYGGYQSHPLWGWIIYFLVMNFEFGCAAEDQAGCA